MARPSSYPLELRKRAVRMVAEVRGDYPSESAALRAVAQKLGIGSAETLRNWVKRDEIDSGQRPGTTTEESAQIKAMKQEIAELKRASDILRAAASFFAAELEDRWRRYRPGPEHSEADRHPPPRPVVSNRQPRPPEDAARRELAEIRGRLVTLLQQTVGPGLSV
ncbi:transposase [Streptomyces sp. Wh19]|nr:transposase [Streptomyces sp. Wh19]MDV9202716.1 transposase [Streptomyces sp. Wh19]